MAKERGHACSGFQLEKMDEPETELKPTHYNLFSPREQPSMKRRVPQYCPDGTAEGHRIGHPGTPLPTVTPGVLMLSQGWAVFLKASCHGAGRPAGLTSAWVMAAKSLVSQAICGRCLGSGAVTTHTSATCHFPGVGHAASNLPEPSLQASRATWFFETSLNNAAAVPPQPPCANHKPGRPQLSRSRVQASTSPATSTGRPGVTHPTSLGSAAWAMRRGGRQAHAALQTLAATMRPWAAAGGPLDLFLHKETEPLQGNRPRALPAQASGVARTFRPHTRFHWTLFNAS